MKYVEARFAENKYPLRHYALMNLLGNKFLISAEFSIFFIKSKYTSTSTGFILNQMSSFAME
jgi:hypothetical protein